MKLLTSKSASMKFLRTRASVTSPKTRHQPQHPLIISSYSHHTNHSTRSPFLRTQLHTQLQDPPTQYPWPHNTPQSCHPLSHWNVKTPSKSQNPQTNQKIISTTSHVTFTYPPTLPRPHQQKNMPSFSFPTIFPRTVVNLLPIIPQKLRGMTICVLSSRDPAL